MEEKLQDIEDVFQKYIQAGNILSQVRSEAVKRIKIGASLLDVAEFVEKRTVELGGLPAFPCNISRNEEAAHATPSKNDSSVFEQDMVKLDMGVHVDGYIADSALTVDFTSNQDIVKASQDGLYAAIDSIKDGVSTAEVAASIEDAITAYNLKPIGNLTGHGLAPYITHAPPSIPNRRVSQGSILHSGDVIAIEPFATNGAGKVADGSWSEIYSFIEKKPVRLPAARKIIAEIEQYKTLPFAKRWLNMEKLDFALNQLTKSHIVRSYPVLKEIDSGLVSQAEHTVLVTDDGCEIITK